MAQLIRDIPKKKRGRPSTGGRSAGILVRFAGDQFDALDSWIARQKEGTLSRPEAIRRLVVLGLTVRAKSKQAPIARARRARELAGKAIERMSDPAASMEERTRRHRRLTKGPLEFREDRVDLPGPKRRK
jgi:hypothetical protein